MTRLTIGILISGALSASCANRSPVEPNSHIPQSVRDIDDPVAGIELRLARAVALLDHRDENEEVARRETKNLAREIAALSGDAIFAPWPTTRARLRTRVLFLNEDDIAARRAALDECERLFASLKEKLAAAPKREIP